MNHSLFIQMLVCTNLEELSLKPTAFYAWKINPAQICYTTMEHEFCKHSAELFLRQQIEVHGLLNSTSMRRTNCRTGRMSQSHLVWYVLTYINYCLYPTSWQQLVTVIAILVDYGYAYVFYCMTFLRLLIPSSFFQDSSFLNRLD